MRLGPMASAYQSSCRGPITKSAARFLFDHLVGEQQERLRDRQAKGLGSREIDDEIEFGRLLHRQFSRLRPAQNLVNIISGAPKLLRKAWPIGHETSPFNVFTSAVHRRQSSA